MLKDQKEELKTLNKDVIRERRVKQGLSPDETEEEINQRKARVKDAEHVLKQTFSKVPP